MEKSVIGYSPKSLAQTALPFLPRTFAIPELKPYSDLESLEYVVKAKRSEDGIGVRYTLDAKGIPVGSTNTCFSIEISELSDVPDPGNMYSVDDVCLYVAAVNRVNLLPLTNSICVPCQWMRDRGSLTAKPAMPGDLMFKLPYQQSGEHSILIEVVLLISGKVNSRYSSVVVKSAWTMVTVRDKRNKGTGPGSEPLTQDQATKTVETGKHTVPLYGGTRIAQMPLVQGSDGTGVGGMGGMGGGGGGIGGGVGGGGMAGGISFQDSTTKGGKKKKHGLFGASSGVASSSPQSQAPSIRLEITRMGGQPIKMMSVLPPVVALQGVLLPLLYDYIMTVMCTCPPVCPLSPVVTSVATSTVERALHSLCDTPYHRFFDLPCLKRWTIIEMAVEWNGIYGKVSGAKRLQRFDAFCRSWLARTHEIDSPTLCRASKEEALLLTTPLYTPFDASSLMMRLDVYDV